MYIPHYYRNKDISSSIAFIRENPFALLVSSHRELIATHIPLIFKSINERAYLIGHLAARNRQANLPDGEDVLCIFNGPHTYISASHYNDNLDVPTWNYQACHISGKWQKLNSKNSLLSILNETVNYFERDNANPWTLNDVNQKSLNAFLKQVQAFQIEIINIEFAEKLSQDKNQKDVESVVTALSAAQDHGYAQNVADLLRNK